ncbi:MAG: hypothetical protein ACXW04_01845 [Methylobacter sp.]
MTALRLSGMLDNEFVIVGMGADSNPLNPTWSINSDGAVVLAYTRRPQLFNAFQLKRRMARVFL